MSQSKKERKKPNFNNIFADFKRHVADTQVQLAEQARNPITLKKPADIKHYIKSHNGIIYTYHHGDDIWTYLKNQIPIWSELGVSQIYLELDETQTYELDTIVKYQVGEDLPKIKFYRALIKYDIAIKTPFPDESTSNDIKVWFKSRIESDPVVADSIKKNHQDGPIIGIFGAYHAYIGAALNLPVVFISTRSSLNPRMKTLPPHQLSNLPPQIFTKTTTKPADLPKEIWDYLLLLETAQLGMQVEEKSHLVPLIAKTIALLALGYIVSKALDVDESSTFRPL